MCRSVYLFKHLICGGKFLLLHTNPLFHRHWLVDYLEHKIIVGDETGVIVKLILFYLCIIIRNINALFICTWKRKIHTWREKILTSLVGF